LIDAYTAKADIGSSPSLRLAIAAYDVIPADPDGEGMVISALVLDLITNGHDVIVIVLQPDATVRVWHDWVLDLANSFVDAVKVSHSVPPNLGTLTSYSVAELIKEQQAGQGAGTDVRRYLDRIRATSNVYLRKSREFALAVKVGYASTPFDVLECFDYAGIAYELLRSRRDTNFHTTSSSDEAFAPYLPQAVRVVVRAYGTLQLVAQAVLSTQQTGQWWRKPAWRLRGSIADGGVRVNAQLAAADLMYLMEQ
jgi:hypothetical protein